MRAWMVVSIVALAGCAGTTNETPGAGPVEEVDPPASSGVSNAAPAAAPTPLVSQQQIVQMNGTAVKECDIRLPTAHLEVGCPNAPVGGADIVPRFDAPSGAEAVLFEWRMVSGGKMSTAVDDENEPPGHGSTHSANFDGTYSWYMADLDQSSVFHVGIKAWSELGHEAEAGILMDGEAQVAATFFVGGQPADPSAHCQLC